MQVKSNEVSITLHRSEWPSSKSLPMGAGESVEEREPSYTVGTAWEQGPGSGSVFGHNLQSPKITRPTSSPDK